MKPAVEGTLSVMKACADSHVKRCVVTSSCTTIYWPRNEDRPDWTTGWLDETIWSDPDRPGGIPDYPKSKVLAERAAWDFQKSLPKEKQFELVVVLPCFISGPSLIPGGFESGDYIASFFSGKMPCVGTGGRGVVDVRDASRVHLEAIRKPEAASQRFIAYGGWVLDMDVANAL